MRHRPQNTADRAQRTQSPAAVGLGWNPSPTPVCGGVYRPGRPGRRWTSVASWCRPEPCAGRSETRRGRSPGHLPTAEGQRSEVREVTGSTLTGQGDLTTGPFLHQTQKHGIFYSDTQNPYLSILGSRSGPNSTDLIPGAELS